MKQFLTPLFLFSLSFLFLSCSKNNEYLDERAEELNSFFGVAPSETPIDGDVLFLKDIAYGTGERNQLDLFLPNGKAINGVVIFFHGGAFLFGTKEDLYESEVKEVLSAAIEDNIAIVNAEYTFIDNVESKGVLSALEDGATVIDFIQKNSSLLGIPSNKIVLAGISAGGGIAQWNGFREQTNAQVKGIFAFIGQSSYDLYEWQNIFPDFDLDSLRKSNTELEDLFEKFYNGEADEEKASLLNYRDQMDAQDPPLYIYNPVFEDQVISEDNSIDFNVLFHSYRHADYLRKKATEVGQEFSGAYQELPQEFIKRVLKN